MNSYIIILNLITGSFERKSIVYVESVNPFVVGDVGIMLSVYICAPTYVGEII